LSQYGAGETVNRQQQLLWKDSSPSRPQVLLLSVMLYSMEYLFGQLGSAVLAASLPTPSLLAGGAE